MTQKIMEELWKPTITPERLAELGTSQDQTILWTVARHPSTPESTLEELAKGPYPIAVSVLNNPSIPESLLLELLQRKDVLENMTKPPATLKEEHLWKILENPELSSTILLYLSYAKSATPEFLEAIYHRTTNGFVRDSLAQNPKTPLHILKELAQAGYRDSLMKNRAIPLEMLLSLGDFQDSLFVRNLMAHPEVTQEVVKRVLAEGSTDARLAVVQSSAPSSELFETLVFDENPLIAQAALRQAKKMGLIVAVALYEGAKEALES